MTQRGTTANDHNIYFMGSDTQCTTTIEQHYGGDESNSSFLSQTNLYSIISCNIQGFTQMQHSTQRNKSTKYNWYLNWQIMKIHWPSHLQTYLNEKILDSEIQMKNYNRFCADRTLGRKHGGEITCFKATEAVDAEQLIAKSNSYVEDQLIHMKKRNIVIINVCVPSSRLPNRKI